MDVIADLESLLITELLEIVSRAAVLLDLVHQLILAGCFSAPIALIANVTTREGVARSGLRFVFAGWEGTNVCHECLHDLGSMGILPKIVSWCESLEWGAKAPGIISESFRRAPEGALFYTFAICKTGASGDGSDESGRSLFVRAIAWADPKGALFYTFAIS
jgi:hypothetical protein